MQLRDTNFGLLICSQDTKTHSFDSMHKQSLTGQLKLLKLRIGKPNLGGDQRDNYQEYMPEYLT